MIRDTVNAIAARKSEPYAARGFCARCNALDYTARLLIAFGPSIHVCRECRQKITGVPDTRNMRVPIQAEAWISIESPQLAPPSIVVRGLLMPGPHVHACSIDDDDAAHSICVCACGATAFNSTGEIEWSTESAYDNVEGIFAPWTDADDEKRD